MLVLKRLPPPSPLPSLVEPPERSRHLLSHGYFGISVHWLQQRSRQRKRFRQAHSGVDAPNAPAAFAGPPRLSTSTLGSDIVLSLEEALYLCHVLEVLTIFRRPTANPGPEAIGALLRSPPVDDKGPATVAAGAHASGPMSASELFAEICLSVPSFGPRYAFYVYARGRGWTPKDGLKYGVDFCAFSLMRCGAAAAATGEGGIRAWPCGLV